MIEPGTGRVASFFMGLYLKAPLAIAGISPIGRLATMEVLSILPPAFAGLTVQYWNVAPLCRLGTAYELNKLIRCTMFRIGHTKTASKESAQFVTSSEVL